MLAVASFSDEGLQKEQAAHETSDGVTRQAQQLHFLYLAHDQRFAGRMAMHQIQRHALSFQCRLHEVMIADRCAARVTSTSTWCWNDSGWFDRMDIH